jgi:zinc and cadmium transporter
MTFFAIVLGTLLAGVGSVWLAAWITSHALAKHTAHLLSLAAGALLATAFMNLLPEAFESKIEPQHLFLTLLLGLVFFFLLDKAELYHHGHEHHHHAMHDHAHVPAQPAHHHPHAPHAGGGWPVLMGDGIHAFGDGVLIAAAFMADWHLGWAATVAVLAHEIPHHVSDLVVLQQTASAKRALWQASVAGLAAVIGGVLGFFVLEALSLLLPYMLTLAASSFIYVALADLIPQLQKRLSARETAIQVAWLSSGLVLIALVSLFVRHGH